LETRDLQTFKTDATGDGGWDVKNSADAAYKDLMQNNLMPASERVSEMNGQGTHASFARENTKPFNDE
jgi:hypothetical protein